MSTELEIGELVHPESFAIKEAMAASEVRLEGTLPLCADTADQARSWARAVDAACASSWTSAWTPA